MKNLNQMKTLFTIVIACLFAISTQAQNSPANTPTTPKQAPAKQTPGVPVPAEQAPQANPAPAGTALEASGDGVLMKDGQLWVIKNGTTKPMTNSVTMLDGTSVLIDGTYTTMDGTKKLLKNGDLIGLDGKLTEGH